MRVNTASENQGLQIQESQKKNYDTIGYWVTFWLIQRRIQLIHDVLVSRESSIKAC